MAGRTNGAAARFAMGATRESRPKARSTMGSVAACAERETPRASTIQFGVQVGAQARIQVVNGDAHARRPAVAATESRNPASETVAGSARSISQAAMPRAAAACPGRPSSRTRRTTPAISAALTTLGEAPARIV
jgi:hypothetical protein